MEILTEHLQLGAGVLQRIGNTPLLRMDRVGHEYPTVGFYAKAEWINPGGSVKDRAALNMIREGKRSDALRPGKTILDATISIPPTPESRAPDELQAVIEIDYQI